MAVFDVFATTPLFLTDSVSINYHVLAVEDSLALTETLTTNIKLQSVHDSLYLNDEVALARTTQLHASDMLAMSQDGRRTPISVGASDHLEMWQTALAVQHWPDVEQALTLTDVAEYQLATGIYDTLTMTQVVVVTKSIAVHASNTLVMQSNATCYEPNQFWQSFDAVVVNP